MKRSSKEDTSRSSTNPALDSALARRGSQITKKDKKKRKKNLKDLESIFHKHLLTKKGQRKSLLKPKAASQTSLEYTEKTPIAQQFAYPTKSLDFILDEEFQNAHLAKFERQNKGKEKEKEKKKEKEKGNEKPSKNKDKDKSEFDSILERHKQNAKQEEKLHLHPKPSSLFSQTSVSGSQQSPKNKKSNLLVIVTLVFLYTVALLGLNRGLYMVLSCDAQVCQCGSGDKTPSGRNAEPDSYTNTSSKGRFNQPNILSPQNPPRVQITQNIEKRRKTPSSRTKDENNKLLFILQHFNHWNVPGDLPPLPQGAARTKEALHKHRKFWLDIYNEFLTKYMGLSQITVQLSLKNYQTDFWISEKHVYVYGNYKQHVAFVKYIGLLENVFLIDDFYMNAFPKEYYNYATKTVEGMWKLPCGFPEYFGNCRKGKKWVDYDFMECYLGTIWACSDTGEFYYNIVEGGRTWHVQFTYSPEYGYEIWREEL